MSLYDQISHIRSLINDTRKQSSLLKNHSKWNMLCASLDAIEDSHSAIQAYLETEPTSNNGEKYLYLYGLLQALFLQQDAGQHIALALDIPYELPEELIEIREARNDTIGHPTKRNRKNKPESYCVIVQMSISKTGFQYLRYEPTEDGTNHHSHTVNISEVATTQALLIEKLLDTVCTELENEENEHRMNYRDSKLSDIFHSTTGYYFQKIYEAAHTTQYYPLGGMHVNLIAEMIGKFRCALEERDLWDNSSGANYHYENTQYPIDRLSSFFEDKSTSGMIDQDAEIYTTYLQKEVDTLKSIAEEIDEEYSRNVSRTEPTDSIGKFINYFRYQIAGANGRQPSLHKKILLICIIDTLAMARSPNDRGNKSRILKFVESCSQWEDFDKVSTPQLVHALESKNLETGKLAQHLNDQLKKWEIGNVYYPDSDSSCKRLQEIAVEGELKFLHEKTYKELFYCYRNYLIHSFREPGYGIEFPSDSATPYYQSMDSRSADSQECSWQLTFPVNFFVSLCMKGLEGLEHYLRSNNIDPYELYTFGDEWKKC